MPAQFEQVLRLASATCTSADPDVAESGEHSSSGPLRCAALVFLRCPAIRQFQPLIAFGGVAQGAVPVLEAALHPLLAQVPVDRAPRHNRCSAVNQSTHGAPKQQVP